VFLFGDVEGVKRVAEIVQNLKSFAREDSPERKPHDINEGIEAMIRMVWNQFKYTRTVERDYGQVPVVQCHPGQINQVVMNMLVNASQAMPEEGGTVRVATAVVGGELEITIADNGKGIPAEILPRIFDPFFTTRDVG
jgi:signal transduction histidine kinase